MKLLIVFGMIALLGGCGGARRQAPAGVVGGPDAPSYAAAALREVQRSGDRLGAATVCVSIVEGGANTEPDGTWLRELAFLNRRLVARKDCVYRTWPLTKDSTGNLVPTLDVPPPPGGEPDFLSIQMTTTPEGTVVELTLSSGPYSNTYLCRVSRDGPTLSASCTLVGMAVA